MSETNNNNSKGGLIIAIVITIAVIYYFLKFLGVVLGYTLILASIVYFLYAVFKKKKTGTIFDILKFSEETYDKKLLQTNTLILLVSGLLLLGLGSWLNPNYDYCECEKFAEGAILKSVGIKEDDPLYPGAKFDESAVTSCAEKVKQELDLDMKTDDMTIEYIYEVSGGMCNTGYYQKNNGDKVYNKSSKPISLISSLKVLYGNMKYKFGWGREEELAELDKMEAEMLANIPKAPNQPAKDTSVVTDTLAQAQETVAAPAKVITQYQINDPDGYTNLRDSPGGKIIKKVYEGEKFELLEKGAAYSKVKLSDGTVGFMYNNRIILSN